MKLSKENIEKLGWIFEKEVPLRNTLRLIFKQNNYILDWGTTSNILSIYTKDNLFTRFNGYIETVEELKTLLKQLRLNGIS
jgi:hypothetical protein